MSMLKPIAPDLFSLRDSSTGVATQWRAASSAFQDMEAMRDERITHEMSCVGNHMRRCNKIKCMDQRTRKYRKRVETSCSGTKHARCLHGTGVAKLHRDAVITCQNTRARRGTVVADESFYELWKQKLDEDNSITIVWDNETTQTKRKIRTALVDLCNKIISSSDCKRNRDFFLPLPTAVTRPGSCSARQRGQRHQLSLYRQPYRFWSCPTSKTTESPTPAVPLLPEVKQIRRNRCQDQTKLTWPFLLPATIWTIAGGNSFLVILTFKPMCKDRKEMRLPVLLAMFVAFI